MGVPPRVVVDADFFVSYLRGDELADHAEELLNMALEGKTSLFVSGEVYDDLITAYRTQGYALEDVERVLSDLRAVPHQVVPISLEIVVSALDLYSRFGGPRRLHYFDSFHVATASSVHLPLVTSDAFILENAAALLVEAIDLRNTEWKLIE